MFIRGFVEAVLEAFQVLRIKIGKRSLCRGRFVTVQEIHAERDNHDQNNTQHDDGASAVPHNSPTETGRRVQPLLLEGIRPHRTR